MLTMLHERWNDLDWRIDAVCRDLNPEIFFPIGVTGGAIEQIEVAKSHCATCPASEQCLEFAITTNQEYGVWGGTTEEERRALRRKWRAENRRASGRRRSSQATAQAVQAAQQTAQREEDDLAVARTNRFAAAS